MDISPLINWVIYQYVISVLVGTFVIDLIGSTLARRVIIRFNFIGIGFSLTVGAGAGFLIKSFLGI